MHILLHRAGLPPATGYHIYNLAWSPDGERLAWGETTGIFVVGADGSGLPLAIPHGAYPYWSPDGTRIAYSYRGLEIASADGTHLQRFGRFGYGASGPWNPLPVSAQGDREPTVTVDGSGAAPFVYAIAVLGAVGALVIAWRVRRRIAAR